jgi:hypothetical protein
VTFEFKFKYVRKKSQGSGCKGQLWCGDIILCQIEEWLFASCAVHGFSELNIYNPRSYDDPLWSTKLVNALVVWLGETKTGAQGSWPWREALFCITPNQKYHLTALVKHPNVKLIDTFTNKAHGGNLMHLYRLSVDKDFKHANKN